MKFRIPILIIISAAVLCFHADCSKEKKKTDAVVNNNTPGASVSYWVTKSDKTSLLLKQLTPLSFVTASNSNLTIELDSTKQFQVIDGFGYTLTGGSATLINKLGASTRAGLLQELFGKTESSIGVSYLRVSIGASDLDATVFSYDDMPAGQTDESLSNFSLAADELNLIPVLKEILAINPDIKIMGTPWSPPAWMKDNGISIGGSLLPKYYGAYANYFVKYIKGMQAHGIHIDAITPQNEPLNGGNNPSMVMTAQQQADFIKSSLGPAFRAAGITTKIIIYDHNCDKPEYPLTVLNDAGAREFIDGSAFHLYSGDVGAFYDVHNAFPDKNLYFTEQWTGANGSFDGDLKWHIKNVIIGTMRNWSRIALEWNLANDNNFEPHTSGGCTECKGALTIAGDGITRNVSYYIVAHASKFVPAGSVRIESKSPSGLSHVAFLRPDGKKVLIVLNEGINPVYFNIRYKDQLAVTSAPAGSVTTYVW